MPNIVTKEQRNSLLKLQEIIDDQINTIRTIRDYIPDESYEEIETFLLNWQYSCMKASTLTDANELNTMVFLWETLRVEFDCFWSQKIKPFVES
jgi:hypothetical protein